MAAPKICFDRVIPPSYNPRPRRRPHRGDDELRRSRPRPARSPHHRPQPHHHPRAARPDSPPRSLPSAPPAPSTSRAWRSSTRRSGPRGTTLRCRFLDGSATQKAKVEQMAHEWEKYCSMKITFGDDPASEVRISFVADPGSWSAIGNDCLVASYFPAYQPTMNFGWLRDDTDDLEYQRVVVHEFGHALGCIHEHQSPTETLSWNTAAVYASFSRRAQLLVPGRHRHQHPAEILPRRHQRHPLRHAVHHALPVRRLPLHRRQTHPQQHPALARRRADDRPDVPRLRSPGPPKEPWTA